MNNRNLGFFRVSAEFVMHDPESLAKVFSLLKIVPVKIEFRPDWEAFEYLAVGEKFEEIPEGEKAPEYLLTVTRDDSGKIESADVKILSDEDEDCFNDVILKSLCEMGSVEDKTLEPKGD